MRRRLGRLLLGVGAAVAVLGVAGVGESRSGGPGILAVLVVAGAAWLAWGFVQRRRPIVASGWAPAIAVAYRPSSPPPPASPAAVSLALARVELRELVTSPAFGVGVGLSGLALYLFGVEWVGDYGGNLPNAFELAPILAHPLAGMVVLAAFRARTRGQRDGVEELLSTCPAPPTTRTAGHLLTAWAPGLVAVAYLLLLMLLVERGSPVTFGPVGARQAAAIAGAGLLVVGATALGIALARWAPWTLVPVVAVVAIGFLSTDLATRGTRTTEPLRQLSTWLGDPTIDVRLTAQHWLAHHLWILALTAVVALLSLLRDRRSPLLLGAAAVAVVAAVAAGTLATRPIDASDARRIAAMVGDLEGQPCLDVRGLRICTFATDRALADALADATRPVAAAAPPGVLTAWSLHQTADTDWDHLDPEVRSLLGGPPSADGVIPAEVSGHPLALEGARLWTGLAAAGVLDDWQPGTTLGLRGQARGVIALWLATRGADADTQKALTTVGSSRSPAGDEARPWPDSCQAGVTPVQWAVTDVVAARLLLQVPETEVRSVLAADWAHWTDPDTSTDDLLAALHRGPVGTHGMTPSGSRC
ncbi:MAG TPA: hypothetical protein VFV32_13085 [Acidimicrobiales bacterium]|nr:hypothetical protein [Acidimicrobiales bacterium]